MDVQLPLLGIEMPARSKNKKKTINVFFAIFLTVETAVPVTRLALEQRKKHAFKGPIVEAENLHVSLINLGERKKLPDWVIDKARQAAASVMVPPFELAFDRVASFSGEDGNRPLVLCGSKENAAMKALYAALAEALKAAHLIRQDDGTFTPFDPAV